ncbi:hypothetical protein PFICI_01304 [Pestalotiopsis fici W106-1]|uniref:Tyrosinase copper-binding domain-containing protein n=1 Tax=Pestalotiopsis fici (strain W106-1 / CGMCC3.15140) TaxID=1229662 RepID=W3XQD5_PESFW|nr:uncharacterized protein PFICI_01304 [Pestalotiopsis fici W106-1]ETS87476.1 hypothetical protein PFICI_01304 [Pestalotiopsis fici W106-1]
MASLLRPAAAILFLAGCALASSELVTPVKRDGCSTTRQAMPWSSLTSDEQQSYIDATLCLMSTPASSDIGNASTRWDELQYNHIYQTGWIHDVGQFLPWHRYFIAVHANMLRDACDYNGPLPYWDEISDSSLDDLADADVFQDDALGGTGSGDDSCITTGPFANITLTMQSDGNTGSYCISRDLQVSSLSGSTQASVDSCEDLDTYDDAWDCYYSTPPRRRPRCRRRPHAERFPEPPETPIFFLHHTFLDALWWKWQSANLSSRLTEMGGQNQVDESECEFTSSQCPGDDILNYDGDPGNTTTLNHTLWMYDLYPNRTVADVMNINSTDVCIEYTYPDGEDYKLKERSFMEKLFGKH